MTERLKNEESEDVICAILSLIMKLSVSKIFSNIILMSLLGAKQWIISSKNLNNASL